MSGQQLQPELPCPECRMRGHSGRARIGNRRNTCSLCNAFAQRVLRWTHRALKERYGEEYMELRLLAELDLYPQVVDSFTRSLKGPGDGRTQ